MTGGTAKRVNRVGISPVRSFFLLFPRPLPCRDTRAFARRLRASNKELIVRHYKKNETPLAHVEWIARRVPSRPSGDATRYRDDSSDREYLN